MIGNSFTGDLLAMIGKAEKGTAKDVDDIIGNLTGDVTFAMTRYVDFTLSLVKNPEGSERIKYYLFNGTRIQRNYASLYFNRLGEWNYVKEALDRGLIDEIQAFAR